jgi:hypothetical protein
MYVTNTSTTDGEEGKEREKLKYAAEVVESGR